MWENIFFASKISYFLLEIYSHKKFCKKNLKKRMTINSENNGLSLLTICLSINNPNSFLMMHFISNGMILAQINWEKEAIVMCDSIHEGIVCEWIAGLDHKLKWTQIAQVMMRKLLVFIFVVMALWWIASAIIYIHFGKWN